MSSIVYLKNKSNGKVYAYLNESVWNSELKKCQCKRKCLGHVDPDTGDIIPNRGSKEIESAVVRSVGSILFINKIAEITGLEESLKQSFPDSWKLLLSCAFYMLIERHKLSGIKFWSMDNDTPYKKQITPHIISEALSEITENNLFLFYREWRDHNDSKSFYMLHTSSISSYDNRSEIIRFNDLPIVRINPKTEMSTIFTAETDTPITFEIYNRRPADLSDIRRRENDKSWLDTHNMIQVLDMEYCSDENVEDLFRTNHRFVIRAPPEFHFAKEAIERVKDRMMDLNNYVYVDGEPFFIMSFMNYWNGKKCFTHIIYSTSDAEKEFTLFLGLIDECMRELQSDSLVPEHQDFYDKYFIIKETPYGRFVEANGEAIMTYNTVAGFVVLISNSVKDASSALGYYFKKDSLQRDFENLKNEKDETSLNLSSENNYRGRLFIQFIAEIMHSEIMKRVKNNALLKNLSFDEIIHEMSAYRKISLPGFDTPFYTNLNNVQSAILKVFDIDVNKIDK